MGATVAELGCAPNAAIHPGEKVCQEWTNVVIRHLPSFYRTARRWLGNIADADDAVQDALLSAFTHLDQFRGQAQMSTWLTAIVINSARMQLRRRLRQSHVPLDQSDGEPDQHALSREVPDCRHNPEQLYQRREILALLAYGSARLSPLLRSALQLRFVDELSFRETAKILKVPEGTVKSRVARARAKLRQLCNERKPISGNSPRTWLKRAGNQPPIRQSMRTPSLYRGISK